VQFILSFYFFAGGGAFFVLCWYLYLSRGGGSVAS